MKIRTNVKAGGITQQHNEKQASGDFNSIQMKKNFGKKLRLSKETVRELKTSELKRAVGGGRGISSDNPLAC